MLHARNINHTMVIFIEIYVLVHMIYILIILNLMPLQIYFLCLSHIIQSLNFSLINAPKNDQAWCPFSL